MSSCLRTQTAFPDEETLHIDHELGIDQGCFAAGKQGAGEVAHSRVAVCPEGHDRNARRRTGTSPDYDWVRIQGQDHGPGRGPALARLGMGAVRSSLGNRRTASPDLSAIGSIQGGQLPLKPLVRAQTSEYSIFCIR